MGQEGALAQADCDMAMDGRRRRLQNKALPGDLEQTTYLFVVVVGRDSFRVVVFLMRRQAKRSAVPSVSAEGRESKVQASGRDPCSLLQSSKTAKINMAHHLRPVPTLLRARLYLGQNSPTIHSLRPSTSVFAFPSYRRASIVHH